MENVRGIDCIFATEAAQKDEDFVDLISAAVVNGITEDIRLGKYSQEELDKMFTIMRNRPFSQHVLKAYTKLRVPIRKEPMTIKYIRELQTLIQYLFSYDKQNKSKEVLGDYNKVLLEILSFSTYCILHVTREILGHDLDQLTAQQKTKIIEMLVIPDEEALGVILGVVDNKI